MLRYLPLAGLLLLACLAVHAQNPVAPPAQKPAAEPGAGEKLVKFDYRQAQLRWSDDHWQLRAGELVLKDFGRRETDGRDVLRLVRELRLNQWGTIGSPKPVMEYWLADGKPPKGPVFGVSPHPIDPDTMHVEQSQGMWVVRDATHPLFNFGDAEAEAKQALAVIQRYRFSQVGTVGRGAPNMMLFFASASDSAPVQIINSPLPHSSRLLNVAPIPREKDEKQASAKNAVTPNPFIPPSFPQTRQLSVPHIVINDTGSGAERTPFEWRQMQVRHEGKEWKLASGPYTLATFGSNEYDARLAQSAVQFYRFTEDCKIGQQEPRFRYFLANGQAARGLMVGIQRIDFRPEDLAVRQADNNWVISDGRQTVGRFGDNGTAANLALGDIKHYKFDTLCKIGHGEGNGITFFIRAR